MFSGRDARPRHAGTCGNSKPQLDASNTRNAIYAPGPHTFAVIEQPAIRLSAKILTQPPPLSSLDAQSSLFQKRFLSSVFASGNSHAVLFACCYVCIYHADPKNTTAVPISDPLVAIIHLLVNFLLFTTLSVGLKDPFLLHPVLITSAEAWNNINLNREGGSRADFLAIYSAHGAWCLHSYTL
jgi:hypothetical protein